MFIDIIQRCEKVNAPFLISFFFYLAKSLSHLCGNLLAHFSLHYCFNSATPEGLIMNSPLKVVSQHFNQIQIWTLTWPLHNLHFVFFQLFVSLPTVIFLIIVIVVMQNSNALQFEFANIWPNVLPQDFLVKKAEFRVSSVTACHRGPEIEAPPGNYTTTIFDSWFDVLFLKHCWYINGRCNKTNVFQKVKLLCCQSIQYSP